MALTKVTGQVVNTSTDLTVGVLTATTASFTGNVSVGGTLTYEDVTNVDSVGLITARNGIEVTDKGVQVGTGATVDSAAANTLTFLTNGSERLRIDSSGNFGIGTASPTTKLEINGGTDNNIVRIVSTDANANIEFADNTTTSGCQIGASGDNLKFGISGTEAMRIDSSGRLLLGTTTEGQADADNLTIADSGNSGITIRSGTTNTGSIYFSDGTSGNDEYDGFIEYSQNSRFMRFGTTSAEQMRLDSAGRLLIGTNSNLSASANRFLQVSDSAPFVIFHSNTNNPTADSTLAGLEYGGQGGGSYVAGAFIRAQTDGAWGSSDCPTRLSFSVTADGASSPTERLRIGNAGNVGIKNTVAATIDAVNSAGTLVVGDGSSAEGITIYTSDSTSGELAFADGTSGSATQRGRIIYAHGDNSMRISTNGSEVMRIDSSGNMALATTPEAWESGQFFAFQFGKGGAVYGRAAGDEDRNGLTSNCYHDSAGWKYIASSAHATRYDQNDGNHIWYYAGTGTADAAVSFSEAMRVDTSGRLLLGTTTEGNADGDDFTLAGSGNSGITIRSGTSNKGNIYFSDGTSGNSEYRGGVKYDHATDALSFRSAAVEHVVLDSSGRLLVGGSTSNLAPDGFASKIQTVGTDYQGGSISIRRDQNSASGPTLLLTKSRSTVIGGTTIVQNGDIVGQIVFYGADGGDVNQAAGYIRCRVDGTPGGNDMPGRLEFHTTADGAASPSERARIDSSGKFLVGKSSAGANDNGAELRAGSGSDYAGTFSAAGHVVMLVNRNTDDGVVIRIRGQGNDEGSINVSGSTVSYNGGHLSRWSQLPGGAERTEILRGSVLSNLDEMCEWGDENNEQLNRMKVSDVEGDRNVSGVFQDWDDDDDTYTNDFYCAMTGDFVIRIAQGTTVARGDLLMSAGDGTAKPQDDDIVRSKTIAKVTSTTVSTTYSDGSYCVPCVLMAC